jgi:hypothetical protein
MREISLFAVCRSNQSKSIWKQTKFKIECRKFTRLREGWKKNFLFTLYLAFIWFCTKFGIFVCLLKLFRRKGAFWWMKDQIQCRAPIGWMYSGSLFNSTMQCQLMILWVKTIQHHLSIMWISYLSDKGNKNHLQFCTRLNKRNSFFARNHLTLTNS